MSTQSLTAAITLVALAACGPTGSSESSGEGEWTAARDTIGDTVVVRTISGSVWGAPRILVEEMRIGVFDGAPEYMFGRINSLAVAPDGSIYVFDSQVPALRKYSASGEYVATFGREGSGPGEYKDPDGGLAVLPDGRVLLRDPSNTRINVYSPDGEALDSWPLRGGFSASRQLYVDTAGNAYTLVQLDPEADIRDWRIGLARYAPDGTVTDTLPEPTWEYDEARLIAQSEGGTSITPVPFSPRDIWAFSTHGYFVGGVSTRYGIELFRPDVPVLRIERVTEPVPVHPDERENEREQRVFNMRRTDPNWRWNGPAIPSTKPPFNNIMVGARGRIWVQVAQPGERVPDAEAAAREPGDPPPSLWREPIAFDVFDPDGRYLGRVHTPDDFSTYPSPIADGDWLWATARDDLDVQYLVRYRIAS